MKGFSNEGGDLGRNRIWKPKIQNELIYTIRNINSVLLKIMQTAQQTFMTNTPSVSL